MLWGGCGCVGGVLLCFLCVGSGLCVEFGECFIVVVVFLLFVAVGWYGLLVLCLVCGFVVMVWLVVFYGVLGGCVLFVFVMGWFDGFVVCCLGLLLVLLGCAGVVVGFFVWVCLELCVFGVLLCLTGGVFCVCVWVSMCGLFFVCVLVLVGLVLFVFWVFFLLFACVWYVCDFCLMERYGESPIFLCVQWSVGCFG